MTTLLIIFAVLLSVILFVVFTPVTLQVDSTRGLVAGLRVWGLGSGALTFRGDEFWLQARVWWWSRQWRLIELLQKQHAAREHKASKRKEKNVKPKRKVTDHFPGWNKLKAVLRTFHVRHLRLDVDTGSMELNGQLYPIAWWMAKWSGRDIQINFHGRFLCQLEVRNRAARVLWAYLTNK
jgi:hypothetical protein